MEEKYLNLKIIAYKNSRDLIFKVPHSEKIHVEGFNPINQHLKIEHDFFLFY